MKSKNYSLVVDMNMLIFQKIKFAIHFSEDFNKPRLANRASVFRVRSECAQSVFRVCLECAHSVFHFIT